MSHKIINLFMWMKKLLVRHLLVARLPTVFLTLSLLSAMAAQVLPTVQGQKSGVNYGINNLRFISPVHSGKRVRGNFHLKNVSQKNEGSYQLIMEVTIEIEDQAKPALVAEWLTLVNV